MHPLTLLDYDNSILSLSNSLLKHYGVKTEYETLPDLDEALQQGKRHVVLMIFDGMGTAVLEKHLKVDSFLRKHVVRPIRSVFPPTTTAATNTFYSAVPPAAHGWLGWMCLFKEYNAIVELFRNTDFYTGEKPNMPSVGKLLPYTHIFDKIKAVTGDSVKTTEIFPKKIKANGVETLDEMKERLIHLSKEEGRHFTICYWTEPDHFMHANGATAPTVANILTDIDTMVQSLSETLEDTILIVSADHGMMDVEHEIYIDDYPEMLDCLKYPLSLEDRAVSVFLKPNTAEIFLKGFDAHFKDDFMILSRAEVFEKNLFGQGQFNERAADFIGDYLIISTAGKSLRQRLPNGALQEPLLGTHAGLTPDEMNVPLIIIKQAITNNMVVQQCISERKMHTRT